MFNSFFRFEKFICDVILAVIAMIVISPIMLLVAICVAIDSRGPVFFKQERTGRNGKSFFVYKFRTMKTTNVAFSINHAVIEGKNSNVTRVGRVLRFLKIDELPQLINIIKGQMSFVGPRPLMPIYLEGYEPWEMQMLDVRPGLTGLSQVNGNGHLEVVERSYYDVLYVKKMSAWTDFKIIVKTVFVCILGEKRLIKKVDPSVLAEMRRQGNERYSVAPYPVGSRT
jgi:lipopolysaccharide/colanic/teichoic acid biosynthesis glycosyltransferase